VTFSGSGGGGIPAPFFLRAGGGAYPFLRPEATAPGAMTRIEVAGTARPPRPHVSLSSPIPASCGEAGPESDVDLLAEMDAGADFSLVDLVGLQHVLAPLLGRETQIGTSLENARPRIRERIERDAIEVF
jgi:predicted nucleotidyltransferase